MDPEAFREAVSDLPAADISPEAPRASSAPGTDDAGYADYDTEEDGSAAPQEEQGPQVDWHSEQNPYRQAALAREAEVARLQQISDQAQYQQAVAAWNQAEVLHQQQTSGMDAFEARELDRRFYKDRENGLVSAYGQLQQQTRQYQQYLTVQQQAQHLVTHYGLPEDDAESLMAIGALDPQRMLVEAERRGKSHLKTKELEDRLARLERGDERDQRVRSGADRFGGRGGNLPRKREYDGSNGELVDILRRDGIWDQLTGR